MKTLKKSIIKTPKTMELVLDGELGKEPSKHVPNHWISHGEYRYYADEAFFGASKLSNRTAAINKSELLEGILYDALCNFPGAAVEANEDWSLKVLCTHKPYIEELRRRLEESDDDEIVRHLKTFVKVVFEQVPSEQAKEYLDAEEPTRDDCY